MNTTLKDLEKLIGHEFKDKVLLETALTHSSFGGHKSYERLEFLGDRVLGLIVAEHLYKRFPDEPEGHLAKRLAALVQGSLLAGVARELSLGEFVRFSDAERAAGGAENDNLLADVLESLIGALYLDGGLEKCRTLIEKNWETRFDNMLAPPQHPKTIVQEWAQSKGLPLPVYEVVEQTGPDHSPEFIVQISVEGYAPLKASGRSRQAAEKEAALEFVKIHNI